LLELLAILARCGSAFLLKCLGGVGALQATGLVHLMQNLSLLAIEVPLIGKWWRAVLLNRSLPIPKLLHVLVTQVVNALCC